MREDTFLHYFCLKIVLLREIQLITFRFAGHRFLLCKHIVSQNPAVSTKLDQLYISLLVYVEIVKINVFISTFMSSKSWLYHFSDCVVEWGGYIFSIILNTVNNNKKKYYMLMSTIKNV